MATELPLFHLNSLGENQAELYRALNEVGFFYLKDHGIPKTLQNRLSDLAKSYFAEDLEFKNQIEMKKAGLAWRGYFPVGAEMTSGIPDLKEGIYFGKEHSHTNFPLHGANLWPAGERYKDFQTIVNQHMEEMTTLGQKLMVNIALSLNLNEDYFAKRFTNDPTCLFRIFNYPSSKNKKSQSDWGVQEHTDMGFLTILLQDDSGGLEVKARDGSWISADPIDDTFVINIGDMLEVWTRGIFRATPHRVKSQNESKNESKKGSQANSEQNRLSFPFFFDPNWNSTLEAIDSDRLPTKDLSSEYSTKRAWDGIDLGALGSQLTYGEFVWEKVKKVFPHLSE